MDVFPAWICHWAAEDSLLADRGTDHPASTGAVGLLLAVAYKVPSSKTNHQIIRDEQETIPY